MNYRFPVTQLYPSAVLSARDVTLNIKELHDALSEIHGACVNAADLRANADFEPSFAGTFHFDRHLVDPGVANGSAYSSATGNELEDEGGWHKIPNLEVEVVSGESQLIIEGLIQYVWHRFGTPVAVTTSPEDQRDHTAWDPTMQELSNASFLNQNVAQPSIAAAAGVQFAICVDGLVIEPSITGHLNTQYRDFTPILARPQRDDTTPFPGPHVPRTAVISGLGMPVYTALINANVRIPHGSHTIQLYARRVASPSPGDTSMHRKHNDRVRLYNRSLIVEEMPLRAVPPLRDYSLELPLISSGQMLATTNIKDAIMEVAKEHINALPITAIVPYSLRRAHLPSGVKQYGFAYIDTGNTAESVYPTYNSNTTIDTTGTGTGWYPVKDSAGAVLEVTTNFDHENSAVKARAHVELLELKDKSGEYFRVSNSVAIAIGYQTASGWTIIKSSIAFYNRLHVWAYDENNAALASADRISASTIGYLTASELVSINTEILGWRVFISVASPEGHDLEITWGRASLYVLQKYAEN